MFAFIVSDKVERHIVTLTAGLLTLLLVFGLGMRSVSAAVDTLNLGRFFELNFWYTSGAEAAISSGVNWETIIFIAGMMIMVEGMAEAGFFRWLCMRIAKLVNYKPISIFITFMLLSAFLAMFIDSITVIMFLAAVTIELAKLLRFNPVTFILAEIFCANLGGSATMCGDPPNIIIGTTLGYSFGDFLLNTGSIAFAVLVFAVAYFYLVFGRSIKRETVAIDESTLIEPREAITDKGKFASSCVIFLLAVVLLVSHASTGLTVASIGVFIALVTLLTQTENVVKLLKKVDYKTLLFFIGLFIVVGGLETTGVLEAIAGFIERISGGNAVLIMVIILWLSALASALMDNIPFAATMIPVIRSLSAATGFDLHVFAWALAMGTDLGGSATPIGASANVVGVALANKAGYNINWGNYCKAMVPVTAFAVLVSMAVLYLKYFA
ncbi:MAG: SLC13 family permease [Oscillospiraceae bacterium]